MSEIEEAEAADTAEANDSAPEEPPRARTAPRRSRTWGPTTDERHRPSLEDVEKQRMTRHEVLTISREIDMLMTFKHPSIVQLIEYYICPSGSRIHVILELMAGGTLGEFLEKRRVILPSTCASWKLRGSGGQAQSVSV